MLLAAASGDRHGYDQNNTELGLLFYNDRQVTVFMYFFAFAAYSVKYIGLLHKWVGVIVFASWCLCKYFKVVIIAQFCM